MLHLSPLEFPKIPTSELNLVLGYIAHSDRAIGWYEGLKTRARAWGWNVDLFCLTPTPPARRWTFQELDALWLRKDKEVVRLNERLRERLQDADVFWNFNGANVHPAWLSDYPTLNIYGCYDDPEQSPRMSEPVARYFHASLPGNLATLPLYASWGIRHLAWAPLGFVGEDFDPSLTPEAILAEERPLDAAFFGEIDLPYRRDRLMALRDAFPDAVFHGKGWPSGFITDEERRSIYRRAKIGWNVHNTVGPVNLRLFALQASGVLQICDNRCRLGQVFELGKEIVGYETIDECIELTRYYLAHEEERRAIAARGFARYVRDYCEEELWKYYFAKFEEWSRIREKGQMEPDLYENTRATNRVTMKHSVKSLLRQCAGLALRPTGLIVIPRQSQIVEDAAVDAPPASVPYQENPEAGASNMTEKAKRLENNQWFEWPNIVALNWLAASLVGEAKRIIEIGCGTGCFAHEAAAVSERRILAIDLDGEAVEWARIHRTRENIEFRVGEVTTSCGEFDLVVSLEVIEHLRDYGPFLRLCSTLAPMAIISTPNRARSSKSNHAGPPDYYQHVREWTAGEFYWVLRGFYRNVRLLVMPHPHIPEAVDCNILETRSPLIAMCSSPIRK